MVFEVLCDGLQSKIAEFLELEDWDFQGFLLKLMIVDIRETFGFYFLKGRIGYQFEVLFVCSKVYCGACFRHTEQSIIVLYWNSFIFFYNEERK